ncbi:MAG: serine/threonine protein kinase, partial [Myxococcales bacterium]|nr:serine/threonine protein kinase [Myxococcales bacterium]
MGGDATEVGSGPGRGPEVTGDGLPTGARFGRYTVVSRLGAGGMGVVYAAYDPELDRKVALKLLHHGVGPGETRARARLLREAQALARLAHPNVVSVFDAGERAGEVWLAMELVQGRTLTAWCRDELPRWTERLRVLADAGRGVAAAHAAGLVHRDLKPSNVMVADDGRVRVMDFGLARVRGDDDSGEGEGDGDGDGDAAASEGLGTGTD